MPRHDQVSVNEDEEAEPHPHPHSHFHNGCKPSYKPAFFDSTAFTSVCLWPGRPGRCLQR